MQQQYMHATTIHITNTTYKCYLDASDNVISGNGPSSEMLTS